MSALQTTATPATVAAKEAARKAARDAAAARAAAAAAEERKLLGTRRQFGRLMAPEQERLDAARRVLRQDGWSIGR